MVTPGVGEEAAAVLVKPVTTWHKAILSFNNYNVKVH
jgi:hypothetical protein